MPKLTIIAIRCGYIALATINFAFKILICFFNTGLNEFNSFIAQVVIYSFGQRGPCFTNRKDNRILNLKN